MSAELFLPWRLLINEPRPSSLPPSPHVGIPNLKHLKLILNPECNKLNGLRAAGLRSLLWIHFQGVLLSELRSHIACEVTTISQT